jgi:hypothetical protein
VIPLMAADTIQFEYPQYQADEETGTVVVAVTRTPGGGQPASVAYATADQTATAGVDYAEAKGELRFEPGEELELISITLLNDALQEPSERASRCCSPRRRGPCWDLL